MVDKLTAVPRARLRRKIGTLGVAEMTALDRAVAVFLGLGG
jgi:mRNA-degrading endonuclease toxin of MazEF toxin-antitoxin module